MSYKIEVSTISDNFLVGYFDSVAALFTAVRYDSPDGVQTVEQTLKEKCKVTIADKYRLRMIYSEKVQEDNHGILPPSDFKCEWTRADIQKYNGSEIQGDSPLGTLKIQATTRRFRLTIAKNVMPYKRVEISFTDVRGKSQCAGTWSRDTKEISVPLPRYQLQSIVWIFYGISHNPKQEQVDKVLFEGEQPDLVITDGDNELPVHRKVMEIFTTEFSDADMVVMDKVEFKQMVLLVRWCYFGKIPRYLTWKFYYDTSMVARKYKITGILRPLAWFIAEALKEA